MADGLAAITIIGTIGREPEVRDAGGTPVLELSVAVNSWAKSGETTAWYRVSHFGQRATKLAGMLRKGERVAATGRLVPREYQHNGQTRMSLDVKADTITLLGGGKRADDAPSRYEDTPAGRVDDIPF